MYNPRTSTRSLNELPKLLTDQSDNCKMIQSFILSCHYRIFFANKRDAAKLMLLHIKTQCGDGQIEKYMQTRLNQEMSYSVINANVGANSHCITVLI